MKKIPRTAKIGRGRRPRPIWLSEELFESNYFLIGQACSPVTYSYIAREVIQLCKENCSNCLWRKTDWALDLPKLGKTSKISRDLRRSLEIVTSLGNPRKCSGDLRKSSEVFGWSLEVLKWSLGIFGEVWVIFGNLWKCSGDLRKSLELFGWSSEIFGSVRGIFGNLQECSGDLRKSSEGFVWPSIIFGRLIA